MTTNVATRAGALLLTSAALALGLGAAPAGAQNNGFPGSIKVSFPSASDDPDNTAKPGCVVRLDFYGFNKGTYNAVFRAIAPTGDKQVASGTVTVTQERTPASKLQTSERFTLDVSGLQPDNSGYHIGVEVTDPARQGSGAKTKNFAFDCQPGGPATFASVAGSGFSRDGGTAPAGGFDTGAGGASGRGIPVLPATGLLAGFSLLAAGAVMRRRATH
ncbi:MAG TPA: hypothetical protein VNA20_02375 [Frankiaceae bacterium]|nr:hypothetical protein [Frankiaceae bacterium]